MTHYRVEVAGHPPTTGTNEAHAVAWATMQSERIGRAELIESDDDGEVSRSTYVNGRLAAVTFAPGRDPGVPPFDARDFAADPDERGFRVEPEEWPE
jgi:hypothetical protein